MRQRMWQVAEVHQQGKHPDQTRCEDQIVTADIFAVVDGATDKSGLRYRLNGDDVSAGKFAAVTVAEYLRTVTAGTDPHDVIAAAAAHLDAAMLAQHPSITYEQRANCMLSIYDPALHTVYGLGDCWHGYRRATGELAQRQEQLACDDILVRMRSLVHQTLAAHGTPWSPESNTPDPGREAIMPVLRIQAALAHTSGHFGYGVLDGRPVLPQHLHVSQLPDDVTEIVLATDGYPALIVDDAMDLVHAEEYAERLLKEDPLCIGPLAGTKGMNAGQLAHDDRSWLKIVSSR